jgi:hypothetical protein
MESFGLRQKKMERREVPQPGEVQIRSPELLESRQYDKTRTHTQWTMKSYIMNGLYFR